MAFISQPLPLCRVSCRIQSADPTLTRQGSCLSSTTAVTSTGDLIGYRTTYSSATKPLEAALQSAAAATARSARPASCPGGVERLRMAVSGRVHSSGCLCLGLHVCCCICMLYASCLCVICGRVQGCV